MSLLDRFLKFFGLKRIRQHDPDKDIYIQHDEKCITIWGPTDLNKAFSRMAIYVRSNDNKREAETLRDMIEVHDQYYN